MADQYKKIHEIDRLTNELTPETLFEVEYTSEQFEGYMSFSATVEQIGYAIAKLVGYASDLDTNAKTIIDAINEVNKKAEEGGGGGGGGSVVTISDNPDGGIDITVDGVTRTVLKKGQEFKVGTENVYTRVTENGFFVQDNDEERTWYYSNSFTKDGFVLDTVAFQGTDAELWGQLYLNNDPRQTEFSVVHLFQGEEVGKVSFISNEGGGILFIDDVSLDADTLTALKELPETVEDHEVRIEALENGGTGEVTKDYVDNGFIAGPNVELDKRLGTTGAVFDATGYCVTDKLFIDGSKTITWYCGNHQTIAAYLVLFDSSDTKIQYFKMSKDNYVINLADYPAYSYLRATFYMTDDTHKTIEDSEGNILFEVDLNGKRVDGIVGLNDNVNSALTDIDALKNTSLKAMKVTIFNGTINAGQTPDWVSIANASGIDGSRIMSINYAFGPASAWDKDIVMKTIVTSTGYTAIFTNKGSTEATVQIEAQIIYI